MTTIKLILVTFVSILLLFPTPPGPAAAQGPAATTVEIGSATTTTGDTVKVPVTVKNITRREGLGGYDFQIRFDPAALRIVSLAPGTSPFFAMPIHNINNIEGIIYLNGFQARIPGPTGEVSLASLEALALASGAHKLEMKIVTLADTQGSDMAASPVNGTIQVNPGASVQVESAFVPLDRATWIPVIFKDMPQVPGSYSLKVSFSPAAVRINSVRGGDAPFDRTPKFDIDAGRSAVTISGEAPAPAPAGRAIAVAHIEIISSKAEQLTAGISDLSVKGASGQNIVARAIPGQQWVLPPATIEAATRAITVGEFEAVPVNLKNIPSIMGLGSYEIEVAYDPAVVKVVRITDWAMSDKTAVQAGNTHSEGKIVARGTVGRKPGPVGNAALTEIIVQGLKGGQSPITVTIASLKDTGGKPMEATVRNGGVVVREPTTVQIGSASMTVGISGTVTISITDLVEPDGLGNSWIELAYPQRVLDISAVDPGDIPFDKPPQRQTIGADAPAGIITLTTAPGKTGSSRVTLAKLTVMPLAEGEFRISLRGGNLNNSRNQPIQAKGAEGIISVKSPFKISGMAIAPRQPNINEKASLTATIVNTGSAKAVYPARLWVGSKLEESGAIEIEPGATRNISFSVARDKPGLYKAMLGEADLPFTVVNPADLKVSGLKVSPAAPGQADTVSISERVENTGMVEAVFTARLKLNQALRDSREVSLKPGEKRDVAFPLGNLQPGSYVIELDGQTASFEVSGDRDRVTGAPGAAGAAGPSWPLAIVLGVIAALEAAALAVLLGRRKVTGNR